MGFWECYRRYLCCRGNPEDVVDPRKVRYNAYEAEKVSVEKVSEAEVPEEEVPEPKVLEKSKSLYKKITEEVPIRLGDLFNRWKKACLEIGVSFGIIPEPKKDGQYYRNDDDHDGSEIFAIIALTPFYIVFCSISAAFCIVISPVYIFL